MLDGFRSEGQGPAIVAQYARPVWVEDVADFILPLPASWREFKASRSRNIKESLRKCVNSLRRAGLSPTFRVISDARELRQALDVFIQLHSARAALRQTVFHPDVFASPAARSFLYEVTDRCSAVDRVRAFSMELDGRTVAIRLGLVAGRSLYLYYSGYEAEYAKYGVMTHVVARAIQYAIENGFETVNLSTGNDISKTRWSPVQSTFRRALIGSQTRYAAHAVALYSRLGSLWRNRAARSPFARLQPVRPS